MANFDDDNLNDGIEADDGTDPSQPNQNQDTDALWLAKKKALRQVIQNANTPGLQPQTPGAPATPSVATQKQQMVDQGTGLRDSGPNTGAVPGSYVPTPDAALDRKVISSFINDYANSIHSFDADTLEKKREEIYDQLAPDSPKMQAALQPYNTQLAQSIQDMKDLQEQKKDVVQKSQYAQAAESLGNALAQFAAGMYGAKHGVDMSGVHYSNVDFSKNMQAQLGTLDDQINMLKEGRTDTIRQREEERARQLKGGEEQMQLATTGEKDEVENSRDLAKLRLNTAVDIYRSQTSHYNQLALRAQQMQMTGDRQAARQVDHDYKDVGNKVQGLDEAIGMLQGLDKGDIKDDTKAQEQLNKSLAKAGISPQDMQDSMKSKAFFGLFNSEDKQAGIKYLSALRDQAKDAFGKLDQSRQSLLQNTTGMSNATPDKFQFGTKGQPVQQAAASAQPAPASAPAAPAAPSAPTTVKVRNKQTGQTGTIPASNLKAAIDSGQFEQVQ